jgi:mannose-6-phosphate isomerase-like protein (cupin superfamily)
MKHAYLLAIGVCILLGPARGQLMAQAHNEAGSDPKQTFFTVAPGESRSSDETGNIKVKVSGADNGGAFAVLEVSTAVDSGAPLHMHHVENEWFYVLEGEYDIQVGDRLFSLKPGASVYAPKLIPHTWHDVGETPGRMLVVAQPAGRIEAFAKDLFNLGGTGAPDAGAMKALFEKHNMEILGPPLPKKRPN